MISLVLYLEPDNKIAQDFLPCLEERIQLGITLHVCTLFQLHLTIATTHYYFIKLMYVPLQSVYECPNHYLIMAQCHLKLSNTKPLAMNITLASNVTPHTHTHTLVIL